ncbi:hypothetical protein LINPERHAP1_LOCUS17367 [Linum perenne]
MKLIMNSPKSQITILTMIPMSQMKRTLPQLGQHKSGQLIEMI